MVSGIVFDIRKFSIQDGPGIRTTVFFKGCPLACRWCHNPESQAFGRERMFRAERCIRCLACLPACPQEAIVWDGQAVHTAAERCTLCGECLDRCPAEARELAGREMTPAEVLAVVAQDIPFYDESGGGVTFSGGEPLAQPAFLLALLHACRAQEIHTAVDTSGFAPWDRLEATDELTGLFLYDLKLMDDRRHREFTGVSNHVILDNLRALSQRGSAIRLRVPLVPEINDDRANIAALGEFAAGLPRHHPLDLLPYHSSATAKYARLGRAYPLSGLPSQPQEQLEEIAHLLRSYDLDVRIGG